MKKVLAVAVMAMAAVMVMTGSASAQYSGKMTVSVPFSFVVENERMSPGDYVVERIANGRLRIHTADGRVSTTFLALPKEGKATSEDTRFVFRHYGSEYFLANIWTIGQNAGWEVLQGKLEQELAKRKTTPVETATLIGH